MELGWDTPIVDKIVFDKISAVLGGRLRLVIVGGAPLAPETHRFLRTCLGTMIIQVTG